MQIIGMGPSVDAHTVRESVPIQSIIESTRKLDEVRADLARAREFRAAGDEH
jgi:hypothetical protein